MAKISIRLTKRDVRMLKLVNDFGVVSTSQLARWLFPGVARTTVLRRIRHLEKSNYLRKRGHLPDATAVWIITEKGQRMVTGMTEIIFFPAHQLKHEIALNEIRWQLSELRVVKSWMTERELRRRATGKERYSESKLIIPDALVLSRHFLKPGRLFKLEVELHLKSTARYQKLFSKWNPYREEDQAMTWYLVKSEAMGRKILRLAKKHGAYQIEKHFGFTVIENFLNDPISAQFIHLTGSLSLKQVLDLTIDKNHHAQSSAQGMSNRNKSNSENTAA